MKLETQIKVIEATLKVLWIFLFFLCVFEFLLIFTNFHYVQKIELIKTSNLTEDDIVSNCSNMSLFRSSSCIVDKITPYFVYNITDDKLNLSFDELMSRGGDCKDWSELYKRLGKELGFYSTTTIMDVSSEKAHDVAILSDKTGYCLLDQLAIPYCTPF
jgi:hypothetical protein